MNDRMCKMHLIKANHTTPKDVLRHILIRNNDHKFLMAINLFLFIHVKFAFWIELLSNIREQNSTPNPLGFAIGIRVCSHVSV